MQLPYTMLYVLYAVETITYNKVRLGSELINEQ